MSVARGEHKIAASVNFSGHDAHLGVRPGYM
jgi:hypothetical protein